MESKGNGEVGGAKFGFEESWVGEEMPKNRGSEEVSLNDKAARGEVTDPLKTPKDTQSGIGPRESGVPGAEGEMGSQVVVRVSGSHVAAGRTTAVATRC